MQLTSILPPPSGHRECQGGIHVMIDYFTDITLANSDDGLCLDSTLRSKGRTELHVESQRDYNYDGNRQSI